MTYNKIEFLKNHTHIINYLEAIAIPPFYFHDNEFSTSFCIYITNYFFLFRVQLSDIYLSIYEICSKAGIKV